MSTNKTIVPFEATHPGTLIQDELEVRPELTQRDLSVLLGVKPSFLNEIIKGKRPVTADLAILLEKALGISADYWLRFQLQYELDLARIKEKSIQKIGLIEEWLLINQYVPTKYFSKSGVLTDELAVNIAKILEIYEVTSVFSLQRKFEAFGDLGKLDPTLMHQIAWVMLAKYQLRLKTVGNFDQNCLPGLMEDLKKMGIQTVQNILSEMDIQLSKYGVKLIILEPGVKINLSVFSFWSANHPCIVLDGKGLNSEDLTKCILRELARFLLAVKEFEDITIRDIVAPNGVQLNYKLIEMVEELMDSNFKVADLAKKYHAIDS